MNTGSFIKLAFPALIEATKDPMAPIKLQSAHGSVASVGRMMAGAANREKVMEYADKASAALTAAFNGDDKSPEYLMTMCSVFCDAVERYVVTTTTQSTPETMQGE